MNLFYLNELPNQINLGHFCRMPYHHVKSQPYLCNTQYSPVLPQGDWVWRFIEVEQSY